MRDHNLQTPALRSSPKSDDRTHCYLILGMLYLRENPLLREPLKLEHIKQRLLGHWGSSPGQSFVWTHLNRVIKKYDLNDFDSLFTLDKPVIFNFHAYPCMIHRLTYRRRNHENFHVRGYKERGNINTPFELAVPIERRTGFRNSSAQEPTTNTGAAWRTVNSKPRTRNAEPRTLLMPVEGILELPLGNSAQYSSASLYPV